MAEQEGLTTQEAAYFESGGSQTEGLGEASPSPTPAPAPAPSPAPQTDGAAPAQQQDGTQPQEPRTVPLAALQEERAERKRLRDEVQAMRSQQEALVQRLLTQQQPQQQPVEPQIPDFSTDPVGHLRAQNELLTRQMQQMAGYLNGQHQQTEQVTQQQRQQMAFQNHLASEEATFRAQAPDYDAAAAFLQTSRAAEYRALGMNNPIQIQQALQQDIMAMVNIAQQNGTNVAEAAYNLAKARGYKSAAPSAQGGQGQASQPDNAARLATIAQGQQQSASLSQSGGAAPAGMTMDKLLAMSDADFAKATAGANWQTLNAELSR